jgi:CHAD domain-containing protein
MTVRVPSLGEPGHLSLAPRPGDAVRSVLVDAFDGLVQHAAELRRGSTDPEEVHDARVAARRFRSHAVSLSSVLDVDAMASELDELGALARALGAVRDLDVLLEDLGAEAGGVPDGLRPAAALIVAGFEDDRANAMERLRRRLEGPAHERLLVSLGSVAAAPPLRRPERDPEPAVVMSSVWKALARRARAAESSPTDEALHALRIRTKRARYAAEALEPFVGARASRFARRAARLQDLLGRHQDAVVAIDRLAKVADASSELGVAAGWIAAGRARERAEIRSVWPKAWRALARKERRFW